MFVTWNKSLITGVELIDDEHKAILLRAEELHNELLKGNLKTYMKGFLDLLSHYVNQHLIHEEELQKVIGYYLFEEHRLHHDEFRKWAEEIKIDLDKKPHSREELIALDLSVNGWLVKHIEEEDMIIADYHNHRKNHSLNP